MQAKITRREALKKTALLCSTFFIGNVSNISTISQKDYNDFKVEAKYYDKLTNNRIKCTLCPRECEVDDLERGFCGVRENIGGIYYTLVHSKPCTVHIDPIEKKPFFHFLPGTTALSLATVGCNMDCKFCQNWQISQMRPEQSEYYFTPPEEIVNVAKKNNSVSIAHTYSEPVVFYEYMYDIGVECKKKSVRNVMVSNGYINPKPMRELCKYLDAVKIDLKAFSEKYYKDVCVGELKPVLDTLEVLKAEGMWFEIVYLVVPTLNDNKNEISQMSEWIMTKLGPDVPVHFSRFQPLYKLKNLPPTPVKTLEMARDTAMSKGLNYVYIGNVTGHIGENTFCPKCKKIVVERIGYLIKEIKIKNNKCEYCGEKIPGVWL
jgi:pyruvate formate lyase activating enzyme